MGFNIDINYLSIMPTFLLLQVEYLIKLSCKYCSGLQPTYPQRTCMIPQRLDPKDWPHLTIFYTI